MLSREEIEQMIDQKIEPLTEEIAALKAQFGKVDLLAVDNRNIRQSLGRIETTQASLKPDLERQEKRMIRFEKQTNDQLANMDNRLTNMDNRLTNVQADTTTLKEQLALVVTMLHRALPPEEQR